MFKKVKKFIEKNKKEIILLSIIGLVEIVRISKLKATISQQQGELLACEKTNKELLKENMRQSYIIGKQQEKLIMRMRN
jgi:hypothetical protein